MSKHTPTPWRAEVAALKGDCNIVNASGALVAARVVTDDAELICRAVNSHDALVEALREARLQIEYLHEMTVTTGSGNGVIARISNALRAAGVEP